MRKIITYQSDGFFLLLAALKFFNVAKAMLKNFALLKEKITSSFLVGYLLPHPLKEGLARKIRIVACRLSVTINRNGQLTSIL